MFLTSMPADRAYTGRTGIGLDVWLSDKLGVRGLFGTVRRVGMADLFHCFDGCAKKVWDGHEEAKQEAKRKREAKREAKRLERDAESEESDSEPEVLLPLDHPNALPLKGWTDVVRRTRDILGRGQGNHHLQKAYEKYGIPGRPKIMIPGNTRMIVYSSAFLRQSFRHWKVRYQAMAQLSKYLCERGVGDDTTTRNQADFRKRANRAIRVALRMTEAANVMPAFLVHLCLSLPHGFIQGALQVQKTEQVFFPLHVWVHRVRLHLRHLGQSPLAVAKSQARASASSQGHDQDRVWGWRCPVCGLLKGQQADMRAHVQEMHVLDRKKHKFRRSNFEVKMMKKDITVYKPKRYFTATPHCPDPGAEADVVDPLACIAGRQVRRHSDVTSIWELERLMFLLHLLLDFCLGCHDARAAQVQDVARWFFAVVGSRECQPVWKQYREYIRLSCGYILTGYWQGRQLDFLNPFELSAPDAGRVVRERTREQFMKAASVTMAATRYARKFFDKVSAGYEIEVVQSHGDHIPIHVRNDSVVLFWLPEILRSRLVRRPSKCSPAESDRFWRAKLKHLKSVSAYVAGQLSMFDWPSDEEMLCQYKRLMHVWSRLSEKDDIAKVFDGPSQGQFDWALWWRLSHTESRFLPPGCEAAFALYHFMGMVGVSEAKAESIASLLKRYTGTVGRPVSTSRIIEKAIVRHSGVNGLSRDDCFLTRCWAEYFGSLKKDKFSFRWPGRARRRRNREYPLGGGSKTIHRHLKKSSLAAALQRRWKTNSESLCALPRLSRIAEARPGVEPGLRAVTGANKWHRHLGRWG